MTRKIQYPSLPGGLLNEFTPGSQTLADCEVTSAKLGDTAVTTAKINNGAVTYAKMQNVTGARLLGRYDAASGVVQEIALGTGLSFDSNTGVLNATAADTSHDDCSIETAQIGDSAITTDKLKDSSVNAAKLADSAVETAKINAGAITAVKMADSAVETAKINTAAVTYPKIQNVTKQKLLGRADTTDGQIQEISAVHSVLLDTDEQVRLVGDSASVAERKVYGTDSDGNRNWRNDSDLIADSAIGTNKLNDGGVTAAKHYDTTLPTRVIEIHVTDTSLVVGDTAVTIFIPAEFNGYDLVRAEAAVKISSTTGNPTIQIRNVTRSADMLSTKITLDTGEKTSYTAATPSVVDGANDSLATGDELAIDIDSAGSAQDLYVILSVRKP